MAFNPIGVVNNVVGTVTDHFEGNSMPRKNPGQFLKDWVTTKLPDHIIDAAIAVAGRDDGSGMLAKSTLEAGQDKNLFGGIFQGK